MRSKVAAEMVKGCGSRLLTIDTLREAAAPFAIATAELGRNCFSSNHKRALAFDDFDGNAANA